MPEIHVLDKQTAELIAAGEVVERPASVAKELLENAVDAGARQITLRIEGGGVRLLEVQDDGCGIDAEQLPTAFIRHATSKISGREDLERICTLGFRGEALPSIASVAKVELLSRTAQEEFACRYRIEGGVPLGSEVDARPVGCTVTVRELFYNTPARMKFLKKDATEGSYVADTVQHLALSHPEISFRFIREGKQQFVTPGDGSLQSAAAAVLGREFSRDLLTLDGERGLYRVTGLITPPRAGRASRSAQYFYINGRYVKNRTMMAALENAYKGTLMQGKFPAGIVALTMPEALLDVNVHPAKTEVRFARENEVFDAVYAAVKEALADPEGQSRTFRFANEKKQPAPAAPKEQKDRFVELSAQEYRAMQGLPPAAPRPDAGPLTLRSRPVEPYTPARPPQDAGHGAAPALLRRGDEWELDILVEDESEARAAEPPAPPETKTQKKPDAVQPAAPAEPPQTPAEPEQTQMAPDAEPPLRYIGELFRTYIVAEYGQELCLLDKHAAHERLLYEQLAAGYGNVPGQLLLEPVRVNLSAAEKQAVLDNLTLLEDAGLDITDFGGNTVLVREVPADVRTDDVEDLVVELADRLAKGIREPVSEKTEWVLHSMACRAAVKAGDVSAPQALLALAQDILSGRVPPFCPHGRPVVLRITRRELEKQFGRIV